MLVNITRLTGSVIVSLGVFFGIVSDSHAGALECEGIEIEAGANCELIGGLECEVGCDPVQFEAKCSAHLHAECSAECSASASAECKAGCEAACSADCEVDPLEFDCEAACHAECSAGCVLACDLGDLDCALGCDLSCAAGCATQCDVELPELDCDAKCAAACSGSCDVEADASCVAGCAVDAMAKCKADLSAECKAACEADGALLCEGEVVLTGPLAHACWDVVVDTGAQSESDPDDGHPSKDGEHLGCSTVPRGGGHAPAALATLILLGGIVRRRNARRT